MTEGLKMVLFKMFGQLFNSLHDERAINTIQICFFGAVGARCSGSPVFL
jgi:hypothetical protein